LKDYWELKDLSRVLKVTFPGRISPKKQKTDLRAEIDKRNRRILERMNCGPILYQMELIIHLKDLNDWWEKNKRRLELDTAKWYSLRFGVIILVRKIDRI